MDLSTTYLGLKLKNPLVPSSSPLMRSLGNLRQMEDAGAAAVVLHSLFEEQVRLESHTLNEYLTHGTESYAEALSYLSGSFALVDKSGKRFKLVSRVHRQPDGVFGEAHFQAMLVGDDLAGNREILRQLAFRLKRTERLQTAATGDDTKYAVASVGDDEVLHQSVREQGSLQFVHAHLGNGAPGIERGLFQLVYRDEAGLRCGIFDSVHN